MRVLLVEPLLLLVNEAVSLRKVDRICIKVRDNMNFKVESKLVTTPSFPLCCHFPLPKTHFAHVNNQAHLHSFLPARQHEEAAAGIVHTGSSNQHLLNKNERYGDKERSYWQHDEEIRGPLLE